MTEMTDLKDLTEAYNYDVFIDTKIDRWLNFEASPSIGTPALDFPLTTLDGQSVQLSDIWHQTPYTIIEFGSIT